MLFFWFNGLLCFTKTFGTCSAGPAMHPNTSALICIYLHLSVSIGIYLHLFVSVCTYLQVFTSICIYLHQFVILHQSVSFLMKIRFWIISWNIVAKNRIQFSCLCSSSSNQFQILGICPKAIWPFCNAYFCKPIWIQSCL